VLPIIEFRHDASREHMVSAFRANKRGKRYWSDVMHGQKLFLKKFQYSPPIVI